MKFIALFLATSISLVTSLYSYGMLTSCQVPVRYSIGNIDEVFDITSDELRTIINDATSVWNDLSDRTLFVYDETSPFTVNVVFDERHQRFQTKEMWRAELNRLEALFKSAERLYEEAESQYSQLIAELRGAEGEFERQRTLLMSTPAPGFSDDRRQAIIDNLASQEEDIGRRINEVNSLVEVMNGLVVQVNGAVEVYNNEAQQFNAQFGNEAAFTQGDFSQNTINIYTFNDKNELTWVLAHEFGHALGLDHIEGDDSVMYYMVSDKQGTVTLTEQDITEFWRVCPADNSFEARLSQLSVPITHFINKQIQLIQSNL